jgi:hypothetical protein
VAPLAIDASPMMPIPAPRIDQSGVCRNRAHENPNDRGFRQTSRPCALRGVMSRLVTPLSCEILDLIKAEYWAGRLLPAVEEAIAAPIKTGEALRHTLAKAARSSSENSRCLKNHEINLACTARLKKGTHVYMCYPQCAGRRTNHQIMPTFQPTQRPSDMTLRPASGRSMPRTCEKLGDPALLGCERNGTPPDRSISC